MEKKLFYIEYLNKKKNFATDKKTFDSELKAIQWGKKNLQNFHPDMIRLTKTKPTQ